MKLTFRGRERRQEQQNGRKGPRFSFSLHQTIENVKRFFYRVRELFTYGVNWLYHFGHEVSQLSPSRGIFLASVSVIVALSLLVALPNAAALMEQKQVTFQVDGQSMEVDTTAGTVAELLSSFDYTLKEGDIVYPALSHSLENLDTIKIRSAMRLQVRVDGQVKEIAMMAGPVSEALNLAGVALGEHDEVYPDLDTPIENNMTIEVYRVRVYIETEEQGIPYQLVYQDDASVYEGQEQLVRQGSEGVKQIQMRVTVREGEEVERTVIRESILEPAQNRIMAKGTKKAPTPTPKATPKASTSKSPSSSSSSKVTPDPNKKTATEGSGNTITVGGETYTYSQKYTMELTAYTHTGRKTATGTWPDIGTLSVDPSVIPYGTKVFVEGYGFGVARDTGVSGMRIDVFLNTEAECRQFGRRRNKAVYIID